MQEYKGPGGDVTIPEGVTEIGRAVFQICTSLTSVTIPEGVTTIGESAFNGCAGLTSVTLPKSIKEIESGAFAACSKLASVIIRMTALSQHRPVSMEHSIH